MDKQTAKELQLHTLNNGIRIIHLHTDSPVANCAVMVNTGSRDELPLENGLAHFIEHVVFKGTRHRKAWHILSRLENVGGDLNAYTTKEDSCIFATFLSRYYERCLELFSDIVRNSIFPEKELQKEKEVVIDEINSYKDSPSEQIFDDFEALLFPDHPLGKPILGTPENLYMFNKNSILRFIRRNYHSSQILISSVGNINFNNLISICDKYFSGITTQQPLIHREKPSVHAPVYLELPKAHHQAHCIMGASAYGSGHPSRIGLALLNNLLGGPAMNTRLNMNIREKYGFCYNLDSYYQHYSDTGVFCIYMGTDYKYLAQTIKLVNRELKKLCDNKLGSLQLFRAKQQLKGQIAISQESNLTKMLGIGKMYMLYNKAETLENAMKKIDDLSAEQLLEIANEVFDPALLTTLIYKN